MTRKCETCGSSWPALVTIEAFRNYKRIAESHPGEQCHDKTGNFGPKPKS